MMRALWALLALLILPQSAFAAGVVHNPHPYLDLVVWRHGGAPGTGIGGGGGGGGGGTTYAYRGDSSHTRYPVALDNTGSANTSECSRTKNYFSRAVTKVHIGVPTGYTAGTGPIVDTYLPDPYVWRAYVEYPFTSANSALPTNTRTAFTWGAETGNSGATTVNYTPGGAIGTGSDTAVAGYAHPGTILSDDVNIAIPANTAYGLLVCATNQASSPSPVPWSQPIGRYNVNTYEISLGSHTTDYVATDWGGTMTSGPQAVGNNGITADIIISYGDASKPVVAENGDSIEYGSDAGFPVSAIGVPDALGNAGYMDDIVSERLGHGYCNFSKGSDKWQWHATASNIQFRLVGITLCNPTAMATEMGHNDAGNSFSTILSYEQAAVTNYKAAFATAGLTFPRLVLSTVTPDAATAGSASVFGNSADETASSSWAPGGSITQYNAAVRSFNPALGHSYYIEASDPVSTARDSGIWKATPTSTTLATAITDTTSTSITLTAPMTAVGCSTNPLWEALIDSETMWVVGNVNSTTPTVFRHTDGSTGATHNAGVAVSWARQNTFEATHPTDCGIQLIRDGATFFNASGTQIADPFL